MTTMGGFNKLTANEYPRSHGAGPDPATKAGRWRSGWGPVRMKQAAGSWQGAAKE